VIFGVRTGRHHAAIYRLSRSVISVKLYTDDVFAISPRLTPLHDDRQDDNNAESATGALTNLYTSLHPQHQPRLLTKMSTLSLTPLSALRLSAHYIPTHAHLPNTTPHNKPLLIYHSAYPSTTAPSTLETHFRTTNITPQWRYTMYTQTHYHSTTHEVLCVFRGRARLLFGGEANPGKVEAEVGAGDAVVVSNFR
jgi:mannose-6-phosphate isomerase-like protein (cupin superfamily)